MKAKHILILMCFFVSCTNNDSNNEPTLDPNLFKYPTYANKKLTADTNYTTEYFEIKGKSLFVSGSKSISNDSIVYIEQIIDLLKSDTLINTNFPDRASTYKGDRDSITISFLERFFKNDKPKDIEWLNLKFYPNRNLKYYTVSINDELILSKAELDLINKEYEFLINDKDYLVNWTKYEANTGKLYKMQMRLFNAAINHDSKAINYFFKMGDLFTFDASYGEDYGDLTEQLETYLMLHEKNNNR